MELPDLGLVIRDAVVFRSFRGWWCRMPARRVQVDETRVEYIPYLSWSPGQAEAVEQAVCASVEAHLAAERQG